MIHPSEYVNARKGKASNAVVPSRDARREDQGKLIGRVDASRRPIQISPSVPITRISTNRAVVTMQGS